LAGKEVIKMNYSNFVPECLLQKNLGAGQLTARAGNVLASGCWRHLNDPAIGEK
jgi:hypothetical protein